MDAIKNLLGNPHGLFGVLLIVGATVLCALGVMPIADWKSFTQVIFVAFAGTQAVVAGAAHFARPAASAVAPVAAPAQERQS